MTAKPWAVCSVFKKMAEDHVCVVYEALTGVLRAAR
jgi:hypothetical protein